MLRGLFNFIIFSSLYVACCAILMIWQTNTLLQIRDINEAYYFFVFCSTICSYNFHWYLTPADYSTSERILWGARHKTLQLVLCALGALGAAYGFWLLREQWLPLSGAAVLTFLYSAPKVPHRAFIWLRKIAIGKTIFLTAVWIYVTTLLPVFIEKQPYSPTILFLTLHRFFLVYAICILFDYRDLESDKKEGIRSLITILSASGLKKLYVSSLVLAAIFALVLFPVDGWMLTAVLLAPVAITALLTRYAISNRSDHFYYFVLDGMVMLSALLHFTITALS
ncbi:UbiA family prenyltransferase [Chitinophaga ginsengisoli]|uniref:UbiA prenyltransferase family protein n=1 Tax=Chitinophaga ginsengisoli TaxID=363837 RepID=A0A2P8GA15_9BACT|nr:UbiA family prenyltransferase [Chitinophaga ginsengisoli]PSL30826.1 UbiA prenyltransferase family protein [Chitinophaga ginsengisoli]